MGRAGPAVRNHDDFHALGLDDVVIGDDVGAIAIRLDDKAGPAAGQALDLDLDKNRGRLDGRHHFGRNGIFRSGGNCEQRQGNDR